MQRYGFIPHITEDQLQYRNDFDNFFEICEENLGLIERFKQVIKDLE